MKQCPEHSLIFHQKFCIFKNEIDDIAKLITILSPPGLEQFFVDIGIEVSNIDVKPPPYTKEQIERIPNLVAK